MPDDRLIVGLDLPDAAAARAMADTLGDEVSFYKIGLGLLASGGLDLAHGLKAEGKRVFLDLKLFDIGATVAAAVRGLAALVERVDLEPAVVGAEAGGPDDGGHARAGEIELADGVEGGGGQRPERVRLGLLRQVESRAGDVLVGLLEQ